jgi:hypothetical protein
MSKFSGLSIGVDQPSKMLILHPVTRQPLRNKDTGEESWIEVLSMGSKVGREHDRSVTDKQLKMRNRRLTADEFEGDMTEKLARLTKGWSLVTLEGDPIDVPFSVANARELYAMAELVWLREQVNDWASDLGNFQTGASPS